VSGGSPFGNNGEGQCLRWGIRSNGRIVSAKLLARTPSNLVPTFAASALTRRFILTSTAILCRWYIDQHPVGDTVFSDYHARIPRFVLGQAPPRSSMSAARDSTYLPRTVEDQPNLTLNYGLRWELNTRCRREQARPNFHPGDGTSILAKIQPIPTALPTPVGLVSTGDAGVPTGLDADLLQTFAPRIRNFRGVRHLRQNQLQSGLGTLLQRLSQLVLDNSRRSPLAEALSLLTQCSTPFSRTRAGLYLSQSIRPASLAGVNGILSPTRGHRWTGGCSAHSAIGQFQPMRSQYSAQYNLTVERQLSRDLKLQVGLRGLAGPSMLAPTI